MLRWTASLVIVVLACWLLVRELDWAALRGALRSADYRWVTAGVLAVIGTFYTRTRRWQRLLHASGVRFRPSLMALLVGQVGNLAFPARAGDVMRAAWIGPERGTGAARALGSVAVEKVWDLLALLVCALALLVWQPLPAWFSRSTWGTAATLVLAVIVLSLGLRWRRQALTIVERVLSWLPGPWDRLVLPRVHQLAAGLEVIGQPRTAIGAAWWTAWTWGLGWLANLAVLMAFGIPSPAAGLLLLVTLMVGGAVPIPGRLGIYEGITVVALGLFGVDHDHALATGLVLHLVVMGPPLAMAAILALLPGGERQGAGLEAVRR